MKTKDKYGRHTINEAGQFHSFDDEPAIVVNDYTETDENGNETTIDGYKARYENGQRLRTERNAGQVFTPNEEEGQ